MANVYASTRSVPDGGYVVATPARTDAIGEILRASFCSADDSGNEMKRLLAKLNRPARLT